MCYKDSVVSPYLNLLGSNKAPVYGSFPSTKIPL